MGTNLQTRVFTETLVNAIVENELPIATKYLIVAGIVKDLEAAYNATVQRELEEAQKAAAEEAENKAEAEPVSGEVVEEEK